RHGDRRRVRRLGMPSPRRELSRERRLERALAGSRHRLDEIIRVRNPAKNAALRLDHFQADALELGEIRGHTVAEYDALVAAVVGLAHGSVHADFERNAADDERLDAAIHENLVQVSRVKRAFARLIDDGLAGFGVKLINNVVSLLAADQNAPHWA